jgi:ribosomal protein S15P/S13E
MRKILISAAVAAAATLSIASPAAAQYSQRGYDQRGYDQRGGYDDRRGGYDDRRGYGYGQDRADRQQVQMLLRQVERIEMRIQRSYERRAISGREAQRLSREATNVRQRIYNAGRDGLSQREFFVLRERVQRLQHHLREERRDGDNRRW